MPQGRPDLAMSFERQTAVRSARGRPASVTDLIVLTDNEEFQSAVMEAVTLQQRVWLVPTTDQAAELLVAGRVGVLVIDTECVPRGAPPLITHLHFEFPDLVVIVAGTHDEVSQFARLVGEGLVYRFLQKPVSPARVRAFIDAAVRRHMELVAVAPAAVVARKRGNRSAPRLVVLALAALLAIGAIYAGLRQHGVTDQSTAPSVQEAVTLETDNAQALATAQSARIATERDQRLQAQTPADAEAAAKRSEIARDQAAIDRAAAALPAKTPATSAAPAASGKPETMDQTQTPAFTLAATPTAAASPARQIARLLREAQVAIAAGNLVGPESSNARALVMAAVRLDPQNDAVRQTLKQLQILIVARAQAAITESKSAEAAGWIAQAQELGVADSELVPLRRGQSDSERRQRTERLTGLARLAAQRLADDNLIEPAGDSARQYLQRLQTEDPALAAPLWQQFAERLLGKAQRELSQGAYDAAEQWLQEAQDAGVVGDEVADARAEVQAARARAAFLANIVPSSQLKTTKYVSPTYPSKAIAAEIDGWVDLEFTVDANGNVREIAVKRAVPTGLFEKAAVDALARWRFQPVQSGGKAVEQRASVRVRFKMER